MFDKPTGHDIPLRILAIEINISVILYARNARMIVDKFQPVALLDEPAVAVVGERYTPLAYAPARAVICKSSRSVFREPVAVLPFKRLAAVACGVAQCVVRTVLPVIRNQLISVVHIPVMRSGKFGEFFPRLARIRILAPLRDVPVFVVGEQHSFIHGLVILADKPAECVVRILRCDMPVLRDLADVPARVIPIFQSFL